MRNKISRDRMLRPCGSATSWEKRSTVIVSGRVQKEERCVGQSEGRDNMFPGSPKRRVIRGLPASPSSAPILLWAWARFFFKSWKETGGREVLSSCHTKCLCVFLMKTSLVLIPVTGSLLEALGWWRNHRQASPTVAVLVLRTDPVFHRGNLC